jgi:hypothetical protein
MLSVGILYLGLTTTFLGAVSLVRPLLFLGIRRRPRAVILLLLGLVFLVASWILPAKEERIVAPRYALDEFAPVYQFNEFHSILIRAPRERVYQAIKLVTADEILFFRTLIWIRRFGRSEPESILNPPDRQPLLAVASRTSFLLLREEQNREIVVGTVVVSPPGWHPSRRPTPADFKAFHEPGFALAAMNFFLEDANPGACTVTTETRVYATDLSVPSLRSLLASDLSWKRTDSPRVASRHRSSG